MPTYEQGSPSDIQNFTDLLGEAVPYVAVVTNASNASPIVITTSVPHLWSTGDRVGIGVPVQAADIPEAVPSRVLGCTSANSYINRPWYIQVLTATTFSLWADPGLTLPTIGNGAYTSGGSAVNYSLQTPFQIPSDGDPFNASAINTALEALADRTQFLNYALPPNGLILINQYQTQWLDTTPSNNTAWTETSTGGTAAWILNAPTGTSSASGASPYPDLVSMMTNNGMNGFQGANFPYNPVCNSGDVFDISLNTNLTVTYGSSNNNAIILKCFFFFSGVNGYGPVASVGGHGTVQASFLPTIPPGTGLFQGGIGGNKIYQLNYGSALFGTYTVPLDLHQIIPCPSVVMYALAFSAPLSNIQTISGVMQTNADMVGNYLRTYNASNAGNMGEFLIIGVLSSTSIAVYNPNGVSEAAANAYAGINSQQFNLAVLLYDTAGGNVVKFSGDYSITVNHYRPVQNLSSGIGGY